MRLRAHGDRHPPGWTSISFDRDEGSSSTAWPVDRSDHVLDSPVVFGLIAVVGGAGTLVGVPLLSRVPVRLYRQMVGGLLVALGVGLMFTAM